MNLDEIKDLIRLVSKSGVNKVSIERDGFKLNIVGQVTRENQVVVQSTQQPYIAAPHAPIGEPAAVPQTAPSQNENSNKEDANFITVKSPMIGTFYRSPGPEKGPFVEVGSVIKTGDKLCIIEAEVTGKIIKVLVHDSSPVDYDQPLFLVDPS